LKSIVAVVVASLIMSCQPQKTGKDELATAFGNKLYLTDVSGALFSATNSLDSMQIIDKYVDNWLISEILYNEAKKELSTRPDIEKLVEDYRKSLYIHELEKKKLADMDTAMHTGAVTDTVQALLAEPCIKFLLVKVDEERYNDNLKAIWKTEDLPALESYVKNVGGLALLDLDKWYYVAEFNNITPVELRNKINYAKTEAYSLNQNGKQLLIKVLDYKKVGEQEPQELAIPRIKQSLMHDRSVNFLKEWKKTLYQNNIQSKNIHITTNNN